LLRLLDLGADQRMESISIDVGHVLRYVETGKPGAPGCDAARLAEGHLPAHAVDAEERARLQAACP
jgi:hypothetical protein